jgi:hypothetical protein
MALINYDIDFTKIISQLLPVTLRKDIRIAWLKAALISVRTLHDNFLSYRSGIVNSIIWNGQTIKLQNLLIAKFGAGIYITNNLSSPDGSFVGTGSDISSYIGVGSEVSNFIDISYTVSLFNFTVSVPSSISFNMVDMISLINKYRMFNTTFNIVIV